MRIRNRVVLVAGLITLAIPTPAFAAKPSGSGPATVVIDGREYGPKDGLRVDTFQVELNEGFGSVGTTWEGMGSSGPGGITPQATWGSSYAISTEWGSQLGYDGKAKAGANIWNGLRIVQVCMWYTRDGVNVSGTVCSKATTTNGLTWTAGPEKRMSVWDDLNPFAPQTIFNYSLSRIRTGV